MVKTLDWLEGLANSTSSTEEDGKYMESMLRMMRFPRAVVVCGIVYLEGHGTMDSPPTSIHSIAKTILDQYEEGLKA